MLEIRGGFKQRSIAPSERGIYFAAASASCRRSPTCGAALESRNESPLLERPGMYIQRPPKASYVILPLSQTTDLPEIRLVLQVVQYGLITAFPTTLSKVTVM